MNTQIESGLDEISWQILEALQEDARIPYSELGRRIGMSPPAVAERVRRLEEDGIITGYRADINLDRVGFPILAYIRLQAGEDCQSTGQTIVRTIPEVLECYRVTGTDDYIMKAATYSVSALESLIDRVASHGSCITSLVLSTPLESRIIRKGLGTTDHRLPPN
jgi:Lrp/AsnC family transcriptional regulator, leucine-responsive regulatory protein